MDQNYNFQIGSSFFFVTNNVPLEKATEFFLCLNDLTSGGRSKVFYYTLFDEGKFEQNVVKKIT